MPLQRATYRHFAGSATSSVALWAATGIAFIPLDLVLHAVVGISGVGKERTSGGTPRRANGIARKPHLFGHLAKG